MLTRAVLRAGRPRTLARTSISHTLTPHRWKHSTSDPDDAVPPVGDASETANEPSESVPKLMSLSRPLGVEGRPSATPRSWEQKKAELLDYDKHIERRRHLVKEASRGYFHDFHSLRHHGGKTWIAPNVLIRENKALYYPDITGVSLTPQTTVHTTSLFEGRISMVSVLSTTMSEEHAKSFTEPALETHQYHPLFRFIQINLQENPLKGFLVSMFLSSIRARTPAHLQPTYLVSRQNMEYLREPMGMVNKHVGYVYLVDERCKIRWAGCGFAQEDEAASLRTCARVLLNRLEKAAEGPPKADSPTLSSPE